MNSARFARAHECERLISLFATKRNAREWSRKTFGNTYLGQFVHHKCIRSLERDGHRAGRTLKLAAGFESVRLHVLPCKFWASLDTMGTSAPGSGAEPQIGSRTHYASISFPANLVRSGHTGGIRPSRRGGPMAGRNFKLVAGLDSVRLYIVFRRFWDVLGTQAESAPTGCVADLLQAVESRSMRP